MFSGIVEELGLAHKLEHKTNLAVLTVKAKKVHRDTKQGSSISVNGVCLTVTKADGQYLTFDIMLETLKKTSLGELKPKMGVNLERALKVSDRISGHFVTGHIDDMGIIKKIVRGENYIEMHIAFPKTLAAYLAYKGSVSLDGVSLTVGEVKKDYFSVYLIPFTLEVTNLGVKKEGDKVNIETDILAKYILNKEKINMNDAERK